MHILGISLARQVFTTGSRERVRMEACARAVDSLTLIVLTRTEHGFRQEVRIGTFRAIPTNSKSRLSMLIDAYRIGKRILTERRNEISTVVSVQDPFEMGIVGLLLSRYPHTIFHAQVHGSFFDSALWRAESPLNHIRYRLGLFVLRRAACIRVVSSRIARSLVSRGIDEQRIIVLPIHVDLEPFLSKKRKSPSKQPSDTITILYVGRFSKEKNLPMLVRAMTRVHEVYPHTVLRLVGGGVEYERLVLLTETLRASTYIRFVPWTRDVQAEMEQSDIYVLSSNHEGYGLVLIEAMASSLPIVTTDVGCVGDEVLHGVHGLVSLPGDENALSDSLRTLTEDAVLRRAFGEAGRRRAEEINERMRDSYLNYWRDSFECGRETL